MHTLLLSTTLIAAASAGASSSDTASTPAPAEFGDAGTYTLGGALAFAQSTYQDSTSGDFSIVSGSISPEVDYFVASGFALHMRGQAWFLSGGGQSSLGFGPGFGVGYHAPLASDFGIFPKVMAVYRYGRNRVDSANTGGFDADRTSHTIDVAVELPLVARFGRFFVGVGPRFRKQVFSRARYDGEAESLSQDGFSIFEVSTRVGGWFD